MEGTQWRSSNFLIENELEQSNLETTIAYNMYVHLYMAMFVNLYTIYGNI